jgi:hypothetical protein
MGTRKEQTGNREHDLYFSKWCREKLNSSHDGQRVYDIDFCIWQKKYKKIMFIELKSHKSKPKDDQYLMFKLINSWIKKGINKEWTYLGYNLITFENKTFEDGKCYLNNNEISEEELIKFLNFE